MPGGRSRIDKKVVAIDLVDFFVFTMHPYWTWASSVRLWDLLRPAALESC
jgi:hypothetical protein